MFGNDQVILSQGNRRGVRQGKVQVVAGFRSKPKRLIVLGASNYAKSCRTFGPGGGEVCGQALNAQLDTSSVYCKGLYLRLYITLCTCWGRNVFKHNQSFTVWTGSRFDLGCPGVLNQIKFLQRGAGTTTGSLAKNIVICTRLLKVPRFDPKWIRHS